MCFIDFYTMTTVLLVSQIRPLSRQHHAPCCQATFGVEAVPGQRTE